MAYDPLVINAGELRHSITITEASSTRDSYGQPVSTWNTVLTTRAKIEGTTSTSYKQLLQSGVISAQTTDVITMRWPGSTVFITPDMRVIFGDQTFLIQGIDNVLRRNRVLKLFCMAIDAASN
jgi:SPP1 family predicted phage head-tail adaptor